MALELQNTVTFDFAGAAKLAGYLKDAQKFTGQIRTDLNDAMKASQAARQALISSRMPPLPGQGAGSQASAMSQFGAVAGAAAAGSAFFYRSTSLANPAAMQRFHDALDDTTAVIGHRLIPALEWLTRQIRGMGDFLAQHPTAAKVAGGGILAATAVGLAGTAFYTTRIAYQGVRGAVGLAGRALGFKGSGAAGEASRAAQASAAVQGMRSEEELMGLAQSARGRAAAGEIGAASEASALEGELAALRSARAASAGAPAAAGASRLGMIGRVGGGLLRGASRFAGPVGYGAAGLELASARTPSEFGRTAEGIAMVSPFLPSPTTAYEKNVGPQTRSWLDRQFTRAYEYNTGLSRIAEKKIGFSLNPFDWFRDDKPQGANPNLATSRNAAFRPATYQDVLGSVLSMRQSIASGGNDPLQSMDANIGNIATAVSQIRDKQLGTNDPTDRGNK